MEESESEISKSPEESTLSDQKSSAANKHLELVIVGLVIILITESLGFYIYYTNVQEADRENVFQDIDEDVSYDGVNGVQGSNESVKSDEIELISEDGIRTLGTYYRTNGGVSVALLSYTIDENFINSYKKTQERIREYMDAIQVTESDQEKEKESLENQVKYYQNILTNSDMVLNLRVGFKNEFEQGSATYNPVRFRLKDASNNRYDTKFADPLGIYGLSTGEITEYELSYTTKISEQNFTLIYENVNIEFQIEHLPLSE